MAGKAYVGVYADGPLQVEWVNVPASEGSTFSGKELHAKRTQQDGSSLPPKSLFVAVPKGSGRYPVIVLQHGYMLKNKFYEQLMEHVASHGFIVVAPEVGKNRVQTEMYIYSGPDATQEIEDAAAIINWLPDNLAASFPKGLQHAIPDLEMLVISGHSRGGKVAFGLALGKAQTFLKFSAIIALDPVDGTSLGQTQPHILNFKAHSFNLAYPTLVIGSGLGPDWNICIPPCAPEKLGHKAFFEESCAPAFHLVASEYGHMDFLDDKTPGSIGDLSYCMCKNGTSRFPMRRFAGGIMIAFLQAALFQKAANLEEAVNDPSSIPVTVEPPESYGTLNAKASAVMLRSKM